MLVSLPSFARPSVPQPPKLKEIPKSEEAVGKAFAEAWLAFRRDMDGLCTVKIRDEEKLAWFDAMPRFLLRDVLRLSMDSEVIYQAAIRLAETGSPKDRRLIEKTKERYQGRLLGHLLTAVLISSGDTTSRKKVLSDLKSAIMERRTAAGMTLAAAGSKEGFAYLRAAVQKEDEEGRYAAWALGRFGGPADEKILRARMMRSPKENALLAALGELEFKRIFPNDYNSFLLRFRFFPDGFASGGLYEAWNMSVEHAVSSGALEHDALRHEISKLRRKPTFGGDSELTKRRLALFLDFLNDINILRMGPAKAAWPEHFEEAAASLRAKPSSQNAERVTADRITAAISLIRMLGPKLDYPNAAEPTAGLRTVSPNADRAIDANIATSWHVRKNTPLILEHRGGQFIKAVRILSFCNGAQKSGSLSSAVISGVDLSGNRWHVKQPIKLNIFTFQKIQVRQASAGRIQVSIPDASKNDEAACITEIRLQSK